MRPSVPSLPSPAAPAAPAAPRPAPAGQRIGAVTHYFQHVDAAIVRVESGEIRVGDTLHFHGHTTDFSQRIDRIEFDHQPIEVARIGQEVGVHVSERVREHDDVIKVSVSG